MPSAEFRNVRDPLYQDTQKVVKARYTSNTLASCWTPASGKTIVLTGGILTVVCTVIAAGSEAAGNALCLVDNVATVPFLVLGTLVETDTGAGSSWPGAQGVDTAVVTTNTFMSGFQGSSFVKFDIPNGYKLGAADNVIKFCLNDLAAAAAAVTVSTGVFVCLGVLWGREV